MGFRALIRRVERPLAPGIPANGMCVAIFDDVIGSPRNHGNGGGLFQYISG